VATLDIPVAASGDDWMFYSPSSFSLTDDKWFSGADGTVSLGSGALFTVPDILSGATITAAYLTIRDIWGDTGTGMKTNIYCQAADTGTAPSNYSTATTYTRTTGVAWDSDADWSSGTDYQSPSLVTPIQEVISRAGWASGNIIRLQWENDGSTAGTQRKCSSYNHSTTYCPRLHIEYTNTTFTGIHVTKHIG